MKRQLAFFILMICLISFSVGRVFASTISELEPSKPPTTINPSNPLKVKPATGDPVPLSDYKLQGTTSEQQKAEGGLQEPQTGDQLQPNAKTNLFSDDL